MRFIHHFIIGLMLFIAMTMGVAKDVYAVGFIDSKFSQPSDQPGHRPGYLIVKYKPGQEQVFSDDIAKATGINMKVAREYKSRLQLVQIRDPNETTLQTTKQLLEQSGQFEYVEYDSLIQPMGLVPNDPYFRKQWGLLNTGQVVEGNRGVPGVDISVIPAWSFTKGNPKTLVAVIDTGINMNHPELSGRCWTNPNEISGNGLDDDENGYVDDVNGYDFYNKDNTVYDPSDYDLHGTCVTSIIAARDNNKTGIAGIAPGIRILPLKIMGPEGGYISDAIAAIEYAEKAGVKICNLSWGTSEYSQALYDTIDQSNMLFVAAAGNDGADNDVTPCYPATFDCNNIISVSSIDNAGRLSFFSNYGAQSVDIAAPGENVPGLIDWGPSEPSQYELVSGTSFSAASVSGVAALIMSDNPRVSASKTKLYTMKTVKRLPGLSNTCVTGGIPDAFRAQVIAR